MSREFAELVEQLQNCACAGADCECGDGCRCEDVLDRLFALLDHEVTDYEARRLIRHSTDCPTCVSRIEEELTLRRVIRRGCCGELAPETLRMKITRITTR